MKDSGQSKSPKSVDSLQAETDLRLGIEYINQRLERYANGKARTLDMANYIINTQPQNNFNRKLTGKLKGCANYLIFKHYYTVNECVLHGVKTCQQTLLCPFCAMRRASKYVRAYVEKVQFLLSQNPKLKAYFVTLTVKDGADLLERFNHLRNALKRYQQQRKDANRDGRKYVEYANAQAGVFSTEFKRGKGSGLWHPHVHMIWLCETAPDQQKLSQEWYSLTGDSYIVDVRAMYGTSSIDGFLETFKYSLKFTSMELSDNWIAYQTLKSKRLINSFGDLRGIQIPETLTDDDLEQDLPYMLLYFKYIRNSGYNFIGQGDEQKIAELMQH